MGSTTRCGIHGWNTEPDADGARWCPECTPSRLPVVTGTAEAANRAAVARDLADALAQYQRGGTDPATVKGLPADSWRAVAELAGCEPDYTPSVATRVTVVRMLERRAANRERDAFAGFPRLV